MLGGFILGAGTVAFAGLADSPWGYYGPILGKSYRNQATVVTGTDHAWAYTYVETTGQENLPAGYMGALARLYKSGTLCSQQGYTYNDTALAGFSEATFVNCGRGTYYSYGVTKAYNGNGYNAVFTFQSPSQNY